MLIGKMTLCLSWFISQKVQSIRSTYYARVRCPSADEFDLSAALKEVRSFMAKMAQEADMVTESRSSPSLHKYCMILTTYGEWWLSNCYSVLSLL